MTQEEVKYLTKEAELIVFPELSKDMIEAIESLQFQFEEGMQTLREALIEMEEYAEETEPSAQKPTPALFTDICLYVTEKRKSNHYFSMARGPPEILRA